MNYPFDDSILRFLREIERNQAIFRSAREALGLLESVRRDQEMIDSVLPYYEATRRLTEITGAAHDRVALAGYAQKVLDSLASGTPRLQSAMLEILADRERIDRALHQSFLPSFELTNALIRASEAAQHLPLMQVADNMIAFEPLQETVARILGMRSVVEEQIDFPNIKPEVHELWSDLSGIGETSTAVWNRLADHTDELAQIPEFLREMPVLQVFEATRSTGLLIVEDEELVEAEPAAGLLVVEAGEIGIRLEAINPDLVERYYGALETFNRKGKDYVRQVSVSLRELFVHLFRIIAPREAIAAWNSAVLPKEGKVTYKAHLKYIYRGQAALAGFAILTEKDIEHVLQSFFVLDEGVHKLNPDFEHEQMRALIRRCEYCLLGILHAYELSQRSEPE